MSYDRAVVYCPKGGVHADEPISMVCLDKSCKDDCLCCVICKNTLHLRHETVLLKTFLDDL